MNLDAISHTQKGFTISASIDVGVLTVAFSGDASLGTEPLGRALSRVHEEMTAAKLSGLNVDMRGLDFVNSAGFKCFVTWLSQIEALPEGEQYTVTIFANPAVYIVHRSLRALQSFASDVVVISGN